MIKIAFFDFDDTLYSHKTHSIPFDAIEALELLYQNGIKIFIATGRNYQEFTMFEMPKHLIEGYLLENGHLCFDKDLNVIYESPLSKESMDKALFDFNKKERAVLFANKDMQYVNIIDDELIEAQKVISSPLPPVRDYQGEHIYMVSYFGSEEELEKLIPLYPECTISYWSRQGIDIISGGGGKETGIHKILEHYGFTSQEAISFGDGDNDVPMLKATGLSVCVGNGIEAAKQAADYVSSDIDEGGIYQALKHFELI